jgi:hypothetical protein
MTKVTPHFKSAVERLESVIDRTTGVEVEE